MKRTKRRPTTKTAIVGSSPLITSANVGGVLFSLLFACLLAGQFETLMAGFSRNLNM